MFKTLLTDINNNTKAANIKIPYFDRGTPENATIKDILEITGEIRLLKEIEEDNVRFFLNPLHNSDLVFKVLKQAKDDIWNKLDSLNKDLIMHGYSIFGNMWYCECRDHIVTVNRLEQNDEKICNVLGQTKEEIDALY